MGLKGPARGWVLLGRRCLLAALDLVDLLDLLWVVLAHCRGGGVPHGPLRDVPREEPAPTGLALRVEVGLGLGLGPRSG